MRSISAVSSAFPSRFAAMISTSERACMGRTHSIVAGGVAIVRRDVSGDLGAGAGAGVGTGAGAGVGTGAGAGVGAPEAACGEALVLCPLKAWMKAHMAVGVNARDFAALSANLEKVAG